MLRSCGYSFGVCVLDCHLEARETTDSAAGADVDRQEQAAERNRNSAGRKASRRNSAQKKAPKQRRMARIMARGSTVALTAQMRAAAAMMTGALTGSEAPSWFRLFGSISTTTASTWDTKY